MKKTIIISAIIAVILGFILIRDYNNYFYGWSIVNYHVLPYGLTPFHWKDYTIENGKRVPVDGNFYLMADKTNILFGHNSSIPHFGSYETTFVIDSIKCYYYNKDSIYVYCVDKENNPHWFIPVYIPVCDEEYVFFDEIKNVKMESLSKYTYINVSP